MKELFLIKPGVIFLNHGSYGACSRLVLEAWQQWQRRIEEQPCEFADQALVALVETIRGRLSAFLDCEAGSLALVPSVTHGVSAVARSMKIKVGDEVLVSNQEYGTCLRAWQFVAQTRGVKLKVAPITLPVLSAAEMVNQIWSQVTTKTKVIFISHISYATGLIIPVEEIIARARRQNILTIIDGAHVPGHIELSLRKLRPDFYIGAFHKWFGAAKGTAFVFAQPEHHKLIDPLVVGWGWSAQGDHNPKTSPLIDHLEQIGLRDMAAFLSIGSALDFLRETNWEKQSRRCHRLAMGLKKAIETVPGVATVCPRQGGMFGQMFSVRLHHDLDPYLVANELYRKFRVQVMAVRLDANSLLRFTIHLYNTRSELSQIPQMLQEVLSVKPESAYAH